ncbi:MAG TPA: DNA polymerase I [Acidimicrobiia bacterium]|nr:DNA polymerase I [Acidimicrobiia bacterium]
MPTLALLDGNSIAYRAFYALPEDLATTSGQVTNAVYGFTRMLIRLLGDHHPEGLAVAWDVSRRSFRTDQYPEYKAQREKAPDHFRSQLPLIDEVLEALDVPQLRLEGYEADDLIATLARRAVEEGWDVLIVTGDRDAFQLIDDRVKVVYTRRGITDTVMADAAYVTDRYSITPEQYVEYAALRGDTSDNLPGVAGVGEKTAAKLLNKYGSLEGIYEALDDQTPKLRENLAAAREQVFLNRELMRLVADVDVPIDLEALHRGEWEQAKVKDLFESLEFHSLWEDLLSVQPTAADLPGEVLDIETTLLTAPAEVAGLADGKRLVLDVVMSDGEVFGLAVARDADSAAVVPLDALDPLDVALGDPAVAVIGHDVKEAVRVLVGEGLDVSRVAMDTALAAYVLNPSSRNYDLADVAGRYLGLELESPDAEPEAEGTLPFDSGPDLEAAGRRVAAVDRLADRMWSELEARDERDLFERFELPLIPVLARMELVGIGVDRPYLEGLGEELRTELAHLETQIHEIAEEDFNVNSTDQLRYILFEKLGLPVQKKTSTGKPSTDASVLEKLEHPIVEALLRYRELEKLRSTYVDGYLPLVTPEGRIHTRFNQMAATTGRLSSDRPNLQNIPVRSETGRTIRRAFIPRPDWTFLVADYSQIELRVLAHMSGDPGLLEAFNSTDSDIHTATAARVWGVPLEEVQPEMRRRAKMINFGLLYGMEAFGLASRLGISREEAAHHIEAYFEQFPDVKEFMQGVVVQARNQGYTTTLFGRRRYLPELKSDNFRIRQMGERMALNAPVQGTAADIIKLAMVELDAALVDREMESSLLLQIHDELVLEAPPEELEDLKALTTEVMEGVCTLDVPLRVDLGTGPNLAEVKD